MNEQIMAYVILIQKGKITIDNVPSEFKEEVEAKINESVGQE